MNANFDVEKLIFLYMAICVALIGFNFVSIFYFKIRDSIINKKSIRYKAMPSEDELKERIKSGEDLLAIDAALEKLKIEDKEKYDRYRALLKENMLEIITKPSQRESLINAFICYFCMQHELFTGCTDRALTDVLVRWTYDDDFYLRENSLKLIYSIGDVATVIDAFRAINREETHHNAMLIHDGLLQFTGDKKALWERLWEVFDEFGETMQVAFLDYFRFASGDFCEKMLELMKDDNTGNELRFACMRYFGKYRYDKALETLIEFANRSEDEIWEYPAIAANTLVNYPCEESFNVLKGMLSSKNWQVRTNAAKSLINQGYGYMDFEDILDGKDRYAREALQYRLDIKAISGKGGAA